MYMHFIEAGIFTIRLGNHTVCYVVVNFVNQLFRTAIIISSGILNIFYKYQAYHAYHAYHAYSLKHRITMIAEYL